MNEEQKTLDLSPQQLKTVKDLLSAYLPNTEVWAYGSRAIGTAKRYSDLDLAAFAKSEQRAAVAELREAFEESNLPFRVDLFIWDEIPEQFHKNIKREKVVVQEANKDCNMRYSIVGRAEQSEAQQTGNVGGHVGLPDVSPTYNTENWRIATIGSLIKEGVILVHKDGNHGSNYPRTTEFGSEGVPFLTAKLLDDAGNIDFANAPRLSNEKADKFTFGFIEGGDVLLSHNATVGRVAIVPKLSERVLIGTSLTHFRLDTSRLLPNYLAAYFSGRNFQNQLAAVMSQTTRNQVPITAQRKLTVVVPPLSEQKRIADTLGAFANKIELNRQINQTLEQIAQAIFKSWFVDFEPIKAKIAAKQNGEDPERAAMRVISGKTDEQLNQLSPEQFQQLAATAALFPDEFEDPEFGVVPREWRFKSISDIAKFASGKVDVSSLNLGNYISTENMVENRGGVSYATSLPSVPTVPSFSKGQVLISNIRPYFKKIWFARFSGGRSNDVLAFEAVESNCTEFLYNLLYQDEFFDFMVRTSKGAKMPRGDKDAIADWKFLCADHTLRSFFSERVRLYYLCIEILNKEVQLLSAIRDALLPKLLTGEIAVMQAEQALEDAACA